MSDLHIVKFELFDVDVMEKLLRDTDSFSKADLNRLRTYKKHRLHGNSVQVVYFYGKGLETFQLGRLYAKNNIGLQSFPRDIRNPLLEKYYWDIDIENCHYCLMIKLGNEWNIKTEFIKYYCDNRAKCLLEVSDDRRIAKTLFLKVAFGGNVKLYNESYEDVKEPAEDKLKILKQIEKEVEILMELCYLKHPQYHKLVAKKDNKKASLFALILQTEERKCLLALDEYLKSQGRQADILIHDGLEVRKVENEIKFPEELLRNSEKYILSKTGHVVKLAQKNLECSIKEVKDCIIDDVYATETFISLLGNKIKKDGDSIYFFNESNGLYECGEDAFFNAIVTVKDKLIFTEIIDGKSKTINYGGVVRNMMNIKKLLPSQVIDDNFITNNLDTSTGKLLFSNGIYDFKTDTFTEGFDPKIVFFKRINRPFIKERNEEVIKTINKILFIDAFDENNGKLAGEYLKKALCMAIYGDYRRKKFYLGLGEANCGKGVVVNAISAAFEGFIDEYDANNLLYNPNNHADEAKRLAWVKDLNGVRIAFSNEIRMSNNGGIDGNLLKTLSSGGDKMNIRGNFENQKKYVNRCTMFLLANDCPPITPIDTGIKARCSFIKYQLKFVVEPKEKDERKMDPEVKERFMTDEYKNALVHLLIDTYKELNDEEKVMGGKIIEPVCVQQETNTWISDEYTDFKNKLSEAFEITHNPDDYVESKKIIDFIINDCKMRISQNKIGMVLKKIIQIEKSDAIIKNKRCRLGIKQIEK